MTVNRRINLAQLNKINALLAQNKSSYRVDLHIHTNHSADGMQTVQQAVCNASEKAFDVIAITDHDSIEAYGELVQSGFDQTKTAPVIVPGIEFTVSDPDYEGRCHVLKYFFDTEDICFTQNLRQNHDAYWNRVGLWFQRIQANGCLQSFIERYDLVCTESAFRRYTSERQVIAAVQSIRRARMKWMANSRLVYGLCERMLWVNKHHVMAASVYY